MKLLFPVLLLAFCSTQALAQSEAHAKPFVLGVIEELPSHILSEVRTLNIYLPEGYDPKDTTRYPVTYLLDGSADEDFIHVVGLYQFNSFSWIDRVPKSIVVGIATVDRKRDFSYPTTIEEDKKRWPTTGHSDKFISFLAQELQPFIAQKYKTNGVKTIIGQSMGGLLATEILLKQPTLFNKYIIVSPSLWWDDASLLRLPSDLLQASFAQPTDIYIGVGKEGLAPCTIPHVMEVDANLLVEKLKSSQSQKVHVYFDYLPEEDHATISHQAIFNGLRMLYPAKSHQ